MMNPDSFTGYVLGQVNKNRMLIIKMWGGGAVFRLTCMYKMEKFFSKIVIF